MREIKFRAQNFGGRWFYSDVETLRGFFMFLDPRDSTPILNQNTLGQFTGLKDKNGKEIYEGDIVIISGAKQAMFVLYQPPSFVMKVSKKNKSWSEFNLAPEENQFFEVVGNIYENPELLKEAKHG